MVVKHYIPHGLVFLLTLLPLALMSIDRPTDSKGTAQSEQPQNVLKLHGGKTNGIIKSDVEHIEILPAPANVLTHRIAPRLQQDPTGTHHLFATDRALMVWHWEKKTDQTQWALRGAVHRELDDQKAEIYIDVSSTQSKTQRVISRQYTSANRQHRDLMYLVSSQNGEVEQKQLRYTTGKGPKGTLEEYVPALLWDDTVIFGTAPEDNKPGEAQLYMWSKERGERHLTTLPRDASFPFVLATATGAQSAAFGYTEKFEGGHIKKMVQLYKNGRVGPTTQGFVYKHGLTVSKHSTLYRLRGTTKHFYLETKPDNDTTQTWTSTRLSKRSPQDAAIVLDTQERVWTVELTSWPWLSHSNIEYRAAGSKTTTPILKLGHGKHCRPRLSGAYIKENTLRVLFIPCASDQLNTPMEAVVPLKHD